MPVAQTEAGQHIVVIHPVHQGRYITIIVRLIEASSIDDLLDTRDVPRPLA